MKRFIDCVILEEGGWDFFWILFGFLLIFCVAVGFLIFFFGLRKNQTGGGEESATLSHGETAVTTKGPSSTRALLVILAAGLVMILTPIGTVYGFRKVYESFRETYSVVVISPAIELERLREKYKGKTHAIIVVKDAAKTFPIAGGFEGACVPDFFDSICRQYATQISCDRIGDTLTIDLKKPQ